MNRVWGEEDMFENISRMDLITQYWMMRDNVERAGWIGGYIGFLLGMIFMGIVLT